MVGSMVVFYTMVMTLNNTKMSRNFLKLNSIMYSKKILICLFVYCIVLNQFFSRIKKEILHILSIPCFIFPILICFLFVLYQASTMKRKEKNGQNVLQAVCQSEMAIVQFNIKNSHHFLSIEQQTIAICNMSSSNC